MKRIYFGEWHGIGTFSPDISMSSACTKFCTKNGHSRGHNKCAQNQTQVTIKSIVSEKVYDDDGNKEIYFTFLCTAQVGAEQKTWDVRRRFSDFQNLHKHLLKKGSVFAEFPSNGLLSRLGGMLGRSHDDALKHYLNTVLENCNDEQCVLLSKFLRVNKHFLPSKESHRSTSPHEDKATSGAFADRYSKSNGKNSSVPRSSLKGLPKSSTAMIGVDDFRETRSNYSSEDDREFYVPRAKPQKVDESECRVCGAHNECEDQGSDLRSKVMKQQKALLADIKNKNSFRLAKEDAACSAVSWNVCGGTDTGNEPCDDAVESCEQELSCFAGVGLIFVHLSENPTSSSVFVDAILEGSPADLDGTICIGDCLICVDGVPVADKDLTKIRSMIVGRVGSSVTLQLERECLHSGRRISFEITLLRGKTSSHGAAGAEGDQASEAEAEAVESCEGMEACEVVQAAYGYCAVREHEMSLLPGDVLTVLRKHSSGWWEGRAVHSGATGWFPSNHIRAVSKIPVVGSDSPVSDGDGHVAVQPPSDTGSGSGNSLSQQSTVGATFSTPSGDWVAGNKDESKVDEVCSWLKSVDLKGVVAGTRVSLGTSTDYSGIRILSSR